MSNGLLLDWCYVSCTASWAHLRGLARDICWAFSVLGRVGIGEAQAHDVVLEEGGGLTVFGAAADFSCELAPLGRIPVVFDGILGPLREPLCNNSPFVAIFHMSLDEDLILFISPYYILLHKFFNQSPCTCRSLLPSRLITQCKMVIMVIIEMKKKKLTLPKKLF